jgi:hypothetical protein
MVAGCAARATAIARVTFHASFNTGRAERDPTMPRCGQSTRGRSSSTILIGPGRDSPCSRQFRAKNCQGTLCVGRVVSRATKTCPTGLQHSQFRIAGCARLTTSSQVGNRRSLISAVLVSTRSRCSRRLEQITSISKIGALSDFATSRQASLVA